MNKCDGKPSCPYRIISINKCRSDKRNRKLSLEQHSSNSYMQDQLMNAKISRQVFKEKQSICITSKYPPKYFLITKEKIVTLQ